MIPPTHTQEIPPTREVKKGWLVRLNEWSGNLFSVINRIVVTILLIVVGYWVISEYASDDYYFDKINVSPTLAQVGYNDLFVFSSLSSEILIISQEAKSKSNYEDYISTNKKPDLNAELLGTGYSASQFFDFTSELLGHKRKRISAELIYVDNTVFAYLHIHDEPLIIFKSSNAALHVAVDEVLKQSAREILKVSDPTTLAYYFYRKSNDKEALECADFTIARNPKDRKWAYNLKGKILNANRLYDSAIAPLEEAVRLDPSLVSAYNDLGTAYMNSTMKEGDSLALTAFRQCIAADKERTYKYARYMLGKLYTKRKVYDSAIFMYKESLKIDSVYIRAMNNLALTYNYKGLESGGEYHDSALSILNKALKLKTTNGEKAVLWTTLGETMFFKNDTAAFYDAMGQATFLGLEFGEADLQQVPYIFFKDDSKFNTLIKKKRNN